MFSHTTLTPKGEKTRSMILDTASQLMLQNGVGGTTIEGVCDAARVGKSQIYHYFSGKPDLVRAVIDYQTDQVLGGQEPFLSNLDTWGAWYSWRDRTVQIQRDLGCVGGCPLGSLASELADSDELARRVLSKSFDKWEASFRLGIQRMKQAGMLRPDADPARLGAVMLGALQGGLLLCQTRKDAASLETVLDGALDYLKTFSV
jgi:TetR/AcrR family transcriptional regulator, transcriptional repressor for nem operon